MESVDFLRLSEIKKWQATYIAPLQPPTLATFRSWGSSAGAGRVRPAAGKDKKSLKFEVRSSKLGNTNIME